MVRVPASRLVRLTAVLLPLVALSLAGAAPGDLDPTFNSSGPMPGVATFDVTTRNLREQAQAVVILPSGRIVVGVNALDLLNPPNPLPVFDQCVLIGLTPAGIPDGGFGGGGGKVSIDASECAEISALTLQAGENPGDDVKIIVLTSHGRLFRYHEDGTPDNEFTSSVPLGPGSVMAVQPDRTIVLATAASSASIALARLTPDGDLDTTFDPDGNADGLVNHDLSSIGAGHAIGVRAVALQGGNIVVGGSLSSETPINCFGPETRESFDFFVVRFTPGGALDTSFSANGWVSTNFESSLFASLMGVQPSEITHVQSFVTGLVIQGDKIVAVGGTQVNTCNFHTDFVLMARYELDLSVSSYVLDSDFGNSTGRTVGPIGHAEDVAVQTDEKIVTSGFMSAGVSSVGLFGVARFSPDGLLDVTFGVGGIATTDFTGAPVANSDFASAVAVALQSDGKIVAVGAAAPDPETDPENLDTRVVRYRVDSGDTTPPVIISARANPAALWPPLHQMVTVRVNVSASDNSGATPSCMITNIESNQPINAPGPWDGDTNVDYAITGPLTARLRAELSLIMGRRTYTLTVSCEDAAGNAATTTVPVIVTLLPPALLGF